jgi:hypothetical protein
MIFNKGHGLDETPGTPSKPGRSAGSTFKDALAAIKISGPRGSGPSATIAPSQPSTTAAANQEHGPLSAASPNSVVIEMLSLPRPSSIATAAAAAPGLSASGSPATPATPATAPAATPPKRSGKQCWQLARVHLHDGSLLTLPANPRYSVVSAFFKKLFPADFDRALPVLRHREVDELLAQWDWHMAR